MEVFIYMILNLLWWMSSFTILLPFSLAMMYNKSWRQKFFAVCYSYVVCPVANPLCNSCRKQCLDQLKEKTKDRNKSNPLKVLEIGIGPGYNLPYYPENSQLIALDKNENFVSHFLSNQKTYSQVTLDRVVTCMAENMDTLEDNSVDAVVGTYVFCSVQNIEAVLKEVLRVLKPGGHFAYLEHVAFPKSHWGSVIQRHATLVWSIWTDGCNCHNKGVSAKIERAGFADVQYSYIQPSIVPLWARNMLIGTATK